MGHARSRSSLLAHPDAKFFDEKSGQRKKKAKTEKGDILIEVKKGTFLKSFDN
jgi:hypothetical protein